jgi:hypothetical protein
MRHSLADSLSLIVEGRATRLITPLTGSKLTCLILGESFPLLFTKTSRIDGEPQDVNEDGKLTKVRSRGPAEEIEKDE